MSACLNLDYFVRNNYPEEPKHLRILSQLNRVRIKRRDPSGLADGAIIKNESD